MAYSDGNENRDIRVRPHIAHIWTRGLIMLLIMFCFGVAQSVLYVMAIVQFLWMLIAGERNGFLAQIGRSLGLWLAEAAGFLSADTEAKPFPWSPWPKI